MTEKELFPPVRDLFVKRGYKVNAEVRFNSNLRDLLAEMADWVNTGVAGELVIGNRSYGYNMWVCTKMVEKFKEVIHGGIITRAEVEVTLEEC